MKSPRVLVFAPSVFPPTNPEAIVNAKLLEAFLRSGWHLDVITEKMADWYPYIDRAEHPSSLSRVIHNIDVPPRGTVKDVYLRLKAKRLLMNIHPLFGNSWCEPAVLQARVLLKRGGYDFVMSRALPDYAHLPALIISKEFNIPWIANWNDPTPLYTAPPPYGQGPETIAEGFPGLRHLRRYSLMRYYDAIAAHASWHTFPCERLRRYVSQFLGEDMHFRSSVVPHIAGRSELVPSDEQCRSNGNEFSLCHMGSLRKPRSPDVFLQGVKLFIETVKPKSKVSVTFIGEAIDGIEKLLAPMQLHACVSIEDAVPYDVAMERMRSHSVLVLIEAPTKEGIFFPSKFVDYATAGRPILAVSPKEGSIADFIHAHGGGIATDCTSPSDVANGIGLLYASWEKGQLQSAFDSRKFFEIFSEQMVILEYEKIFTFL